MINSIRKLILALLAQLPLLSAFDKWKEQAQQYPVAAVLICLAYELTVFALAFGKEVWLKLKPEAVQYIVDWIRASLRGFAPGLLRRYEFHVINEHGIFNV